MKKHRRTRTVALLAWAAAVAAQATAQATTSRPVQQQTPPAPGALVAQALLDAMREASGVPGMGAAVVQQGKLVWQGSSGRADIARHQPVDADTRFRLASVSKVFTATALARLAQEERIDPHAPLSAAGNPPDWLPAGWGAITAAQLAAHTAGVPHYELQDTGRGGRAFSSAQDAARAHLAGRSLLATPGQQYRYSSWGYTLLSAAIEAGSGRSFADYLAGTLTQGLAIAPEDIYRSADSSRSRPYTLTPTGVEEAEAHDYSYSLGGAGLEATPAALALWGGRLLQGDLLIERWRQWMWSPQQHSDGRAVREPRGDTMGIGWRLGHDLQGLPLRHHAGVTSGARSALLLWPTLGMGVSLLSNALWTTAIERNAELLSAPFRALPADLVRSPCPTGAHTLSISDAGQTHAVPAQFSETAGLCRATLQLPEALAPLFSAAPQRPRRTVQLIALGPGLARAALATPLGLLEWRATGPQAAQLRLPADSRVVTVRWPQLP
ncbi:serine hydrolase domain-containing protein [Roseateles sp.]|jgi:serine beta-lactamase-like protein LACTB|uniref:serine hydrolase domain-containing protein n=1 Tax=Roseateles sp. TaxID=1971397 RepID=UPI0037C90C0F